MRPTCSVLLLLLLLPHASEALLKCFVGNLSGNNRPYSVKKQKKMGKGRFVSYFSFVKIQRDQLLPLVLWKHISFVDDLYLKTPTFANKSDNNNILTIFPSLDLEPRLRLRRWQVRILRGGQGGRKGKVRFFKYFFVWNSGEWENLFFF